MADLLYRTLPNSFKFSRFSLLSVPLSFSSYPNFSIIRFAPLRRRFSQPSNLAKLSSDSSQFDIISTTEHSDGTVIFKFGDASEIPESVESGNEMALVDNDDVTDNETDSTKEESIIINSIGAKEIGDELLDSSLIDSDDAEFCENSTSIVDASATAPAVSDIVSHFDAQSRQSSVEDEQIIDSTSIAEVEESTGLDMAKVGDKQVDNIVATFDSGVDVMIEKLEELTQASEEMIEYGGDELLSVASEETNDCGKLEDCGVESLPVNFQVTIDGGKLENDGVESLPVASQEISDDGKLENAHVESLPVASQETETSDEGKLENAGVESMPAASLEIETNDDGKLENAGVELLPESCKETIDGGKLENGGIDLLLVASQETIGGSKHENRGVESLPIASEGTSDENNCFKSLSMPTQETSNDGKPENSGVESLSTASEEIDGGDEVSSTIANEEMSYGGKLEHGGDERSAMSEEVIDSCQLDSIGDERFTNTSEEMIDGGSLLSISSEEIADVDKAVVAGEESFSITETTLNSEASDAVVSLEGVEPEANDDAVEIELTFPQLEAEPILDEETSYDSLVDVVVVASSFGSDKVMEAGHSSIARLNDDQRTHDISDTAPPANEDTKVASKETTFDRTNSLNFEDVSSGAASSPLVSEAIDSSHVTNSQSNDDQHCTATSKSADPGLESSELASVVVSIDSVEISSVANHMMPAAAFSPDSSQGHDATTHSISQSEDLGEILVAAGPFLSGINSAETSLESSNEVEISAPAYFISSAVASLSHSHEALTGGKDAYFVSKDWFGVADGVGQWSFEGIDVGLYAHELMQNCEKLLQSTSGRVTSVRDLLRQSVAMTQSMGSARVVIAHVADQVLHVANIGDSGFIIIRNGVVFKKSSPMVHEFGFPYAIGFSDDTTEDIEEYHIDLEDGDIIVTATDGLFDNLYEQEIASTVSKAVEAGMCVQDLAELLATKAQEVGKSEYARTPFADEAQAAGHPGCSGGKFDHVTVIVSRVQTR